MSAHVKIQTEKNLYAVGESSHVRNGELMNRVTPRLRNRVEEFLRMVEPAPIVV